MNIRAFQPADEQAVIELWRRCDLIRPLNDPHMDILRKQKVDPELFLVGELAGKLIASVMAGYEGHRGWLNYVAVAPENQRKGYAGIIVAEAERLLRQIGCAKINLQVRTTNKSVIAFYHKLGYSIDAVVGMGKRFK